MGILLIRCYYIVRVFQNIGNSKVKDVYKKTATTLETISTAQRVAVGSYCDWLIINIQNVQYVVCLSSSSKNCRCAEIILDHYSALLLVKIHQRNLIIDCKKKTFSPWRKLNHPLSYSWHEVIVIWIITFTSSFVDYKWH